jgi:protein involved in polysaccharide export with SLBB domain
MITNLASHSPRNFELVRAWRGPWNRVLVSFIPTFTAFLFFLFSICSAVSQDTDSSQDQVSPAMGQMPAVTVSTTYRLSPYDVIDCSVYGEKDLHTRARLGADGTALLPLIGTVHLDGLTVAEANELIRKKYANGLVENPHVLLTVVEYRKNTFRIIGQVTRPGIYEIPEGTHMTVVDAVLLAGGFTRIADQNGVRIKRMVNGKPTIFKVRAGDMADAQNVPPFEVEPNDIITVKESWW